MQHQQTTENFVQLNNKRFSIQQFIDILEYQKQILSETNKAMSKFAEDFSEKECDEAQDDDNFGLVETEVDEVDKIKENCIQAVLNSFDFESVVSVLNYICKENTDYDIELDKAYEFLSNCYDEWKADSNKKFCCQKFVKYLEYYECNIEPDGVICLKFVPLRVSFRIQGNPWN